MSQPRRRRRRRRRGGGGASQQAEGKPSAAPTGQAEAPADGRISGRSRRRRKRGRSAHEPRTPKSLEEVVSDVRGPRPARLTAEPDGQTLEGVIGDLQSIWGVPQYPQEYRITLKVADDKSSQSNGQSRQSSESVPNGVTRERAPAAPRVAPSPASAEAVTREKAPRRRRRSRRGRRRGSKGDSG